MVERDHLTGGWQGGQKCAATAANVAIDLKPASRAREGLREVISRPEAVKRGLSRYFTGQPCVRGHVAERHVRNSTCAECSKESRRLVEDRVTSENRARAEAIRASGEAVALEFGRELARELASRIAADISASLVPVLVRHLPRLLKEHVRDGGPSFRQKARGVRRRGGAEAIKAGSVTGYDLRNLLAKQAGRCAACSCDISQGFEVDHIVPVALGGGGGLGNLQLLCSPCNNRKGARDPIEFAQSNGRLL